MLNGPQNQVSLISFNIFVNFYLTAFSIVELSGYVYLPLVSVQIGTHVLQMDLHTVLSVHRGPKIFKKYEKRLCNRLQMKLLNFIFNIIEISTYMK